MFACMYIFKKHKVLYKAIIQWQDRKMTNPWVIHIFCFNCCIHAKDLIVCVCYLALTNKSIAITHLFSCRAISSVNI